MQKANKIDFINILLIIGSALLAFYIPFELFLFVYAFLGPLHYLTEINWLHQKSYYTTNKNDYWLLIAILLFIGLIVFSPLRNYGRTFLPVFIAFAFFSAFVMQYYETKKSKFIGYIISLIISILLFILVQEKTEIVFSIFLPSLIHVFIFTGLFILIGALKTKSLWAKISLAAFILCTVSLIILPVHSEFSFITNLKLQENYHSFEKINQTLINFFSDNSNTVFTSTIGIQIMRFIAFAYTYHYLNWFSKTSIIQWHKTTKLKMIAIITIWIISVALYIYNYNLGLKWLYLLSLAHVFLEFPLNFTTFRMLFSNVKNK